MSTHGIKMQNFTANVSTLSEPLLTDGILIPIGSLVIIENVLAIIILYRCTRLNFQIRLLSLNLTLTDLLTGIMLSVPLQTLRFGEENCEFKKYTSFLFLNTSLLTVTLFNLDRCFVFWFSMRYYAYITKRLILKFCVILWSVSLLMTYMMFFNSDMPFGIHCGFMYTLEKNFINTSGKSLILIFILSNLFLYGYMLFYVKHRMRMIFNINSTGNLAPSNQSKVAIKLSVLTGTFLIMFTPFIITLTFPILNYSKKTGILVHNLTGSLMLLNSAVNPILYVWRFKEPRYLLKRMCCFFNTNLLTKLRDRQERGITSIDLKTYGNS